MKTCCFDCKLGTVCAIMHIIPNPKTNGNYILLCKKCYKQRLGD